MEAGPRHSSTERGITRRETLKRGAVGLTILSSGSLVAACSSDDDQTADELRIGLTSGGTSGTLDPDAGAGTFADSARIANVYDRLTIRDANYDVQLSAAEEVTPNANGDVWTIRLKDGIEFQNGKTADADDLIYSMRRHAAPSSIHAGLLTSVDRERMRKLDSRTVEVPLTQPFALLPENLTVAGFLLPEGYNPKKPIGTGPFSLVSLRPGKETKLKRFPNYFQDSAKVETVRLIEFADDAARTNALLAGQVEAIDSLPATQVRTLESNPDVESSISESATWRPFCMDTSQQPFDDVRVRQAMRLIVGREQIIDQALDSQGDVGNDVFGRFDPAYLGDEFPQREPDIEQARSLLKQAGQENLTVQLSTSDVAGGLLEASTVLVEQAKQAGVTVQLDRIPASEYFGDKWLTYPFCVDYWGLGSYFDVAGLALRKGANYGATTHWNDREWQRLFNQAIVALDPGRRNELAAELQRIDYDRGGYIIWGFVNQIDALSKNITGVRTGKFTFPLGDLEFRYVSFV